MSHHYARHVLEPAPATRLGRSATSGGLTLLVVALMLLFALQKPGWLPARRVAAAPIVLALLPPAKPEPEPAVAPPAPLKPETGPHRRDGGQRPRRSVAAPRSDPPTPERRVAEAIEVTPAPAPSVAPEIDVAALAALDGTSLQPADEGDRDGNGGRGSGTGSGSGSGEGESDGGDLHGKVKLRRADWVWRPTSQMVRPFFPKAAAARKASGQALIACRVLLSTRVHDCRVLAVTTPDLDFGRAAIAAASIFRVYPPRRDGKPVNDMWVAIPVTWLYSAH